MIAALDRRLFAPSSGHAVASVRTAMCVAIGLRLAFRNWSALAAQPDELYSPLGVVRLIPSMPPWGVLVAVHVAGVLCALAAALGWRPRWTMTAAWLSLLVLAGLRSSAGKILHNDVLMLLAAFPLLFVPDDARRGDPSTSVRWGWQVRSATAVVAAVYALTGVQKLIHSGLDWVTSDNMRWVMYAAAAGGRAPTSLALAIADRPWLAHVVAAGLLAVELTTPLVLWWQRTRPWFFAVAVVLHGGTWVVLGLDYWGWILTVAALVLPWGARRRPRPATWAFQT